MNKLLYISFIVLFFGCEKVVELDIAQSDPQIVIEGLLTNQDTVHYVKVSSSIQFYEVGFNPVVDANIVVTASGEEYLYSHNPNGYR